MPPDMTGLRCLRFVTWLSLAAALMIVALPRAASAQAPDDSLAAARKAFDTGQAAFDKGDFKAAAEAFLAAHGHKKFAAFLFNAAVCFEKLGELERAVQLFNQYLAEEPNASDKDEVQKRVKSLEEEITRRKANPPADPATQPAAPALPTLKTKGLVYVASEPSGATVYLDDKSHAALGVTPFAVHVEGMHNLVFELQGYATAKKGISPDSGKILDVQVSLAREEKLGWLEITSNVPGASVYIDSKDVGSAGITPWRGNVQAGKRMIWVAKDGYTEAQEEVTIVAGQAHTIAFTQEEAAVGWVRIRSDESGVGARVSLDGKRVCDKAPCRFEAPEGRHTVGVARDGMKPLVKKIEIVRKTETGLDVRLVEKESYWGAATVWLLLGAGLAGGGIYLSTLDAEVDENNDGENDRSSFAENAIKYGPVTGYVAGGLCLIGVAYNIWFRDDPPYSSAKVESKDVSWIVPTVGPGYAGFSATIDF
jgi:tetratricopeptide (TPR) repeat protein